jgi:hypothetical protein
MHTAARSFSRLSDKILRIVARIQVAAPAVESGTFLRMRASLIWLKVPLASLPKGPATSSLGIFYRI